MIDRIQYKVLYPCLAMFSKPYTRTSSKGKKHLVRRKKLKRNLQLAAGIAALPVAIAAGVFGSRALASKLLKNKKYSIGSKTDKLQKVLDDLNVSDARIKQQTAKNKQVFEEQKRITDQILNRPRGGSSVREVKSPKNITKDSFVEDVWDD